MSNFIEAACINSFHSCNRAHAEVTVSDTFSVFITSMAGIKGRSKWLEPIESPHPPIIQADSVNASMVPLVTDDIGSQPTTDAVGSAEISLLLGNAQHSPQVGTNDDVTLDLGSTPYPVPGSQASGLARMPLGSMVGSPDSTLWSDSDPLNLAFLDAATGHSTSMTSVTVQGGASTFATTSSKTRRLTRQQVLIREARDFIETAGGDIHASSLTQPNPTSDNLAFGPIRNASTQGVADNQRITSPRRTRNRYK